MFGKYFKFLSSAKAAQAQNDPEILADRPPPIDRMVPMMDAPLRDCIVHDTVVDTSRTDKIEHNLLDIPTHGARTVASELMHRFLGRQPIMNVSGDIIGYEMRIKKTSPPHGHGASVLQQMIDEMLLASLEDLDIHHLRGSKRIFVTLTPPTLNTAFLDRIKGDGIVLMFTPPDGPLDRLIVRCQALHERGFRLGLIQPQYREDMDGLLPWIDIIRIDPTPYDALELGELTVNIKRHGDFELLANHLESEELYHACRKLGFSLFQGYFFAKPLSVQTREVDTQRLRVMQLLNLTINHAELSALEKQFKLDPVLSYKLVRYINSPATGLLQPVRSINHALVVLGHDQLYRWLTLLLFASGQADHRTLALMRNALVRARLTELLGSNRLTPEDQDGLFITGMFSLLDALLNMPLKSALENLKLTPPVEAALLHREGIYAPYLDLAIACEESEEQVIATYAATGGISAEHINFAHVQALVWAEEVDLKTA